MEACYTNNLSKMEQKEFLKLINDRTLVIIPSVKGVRQYFFPLNIIKT